MLIGNDVDLRYTRKTVEEMISDCMPVSHILSNQLQHGYDYILGVSVEPVNE